MATESQIESRVTSGERRNTNSYVRKNNLFLQNEPNLNI